MSEAYWAYFNERLALEAQSSGNENSLDITIKSHMLCEQHCRYEEDRTEEHRGLLHSLWYTFFLAAQNYEEINPKHDTLLRLILEIRECGTIAASQAAFLESRNIARPQYGHKLFKDLPYFVHDFYTLYFEHRSTMTLAQRCQLSFFVGGLINVGVCGDEFSAFALMDLRDVFETKHNTPLTPDQNTSPSEEDLLDLAYTWFGDPIVKIRYLSDIHFNTYPFLEDMGKASEALTPGELARESGVTANGFSEARWQFWKEKLRLLAVKRGLRKIPENRNGHLMSPRRSAEQETWETMRKCDGESSDEDDDGDSDGEESDETELDHGSGPWLHVSLDLCAER